MNEISSVQKLGKNLGGYCGETIDILHLLRNIISVAPRHGWSVEVFHEQAGFQWLALHRPPLCSAQNSFRVYISAGIHGDEPAGPVASLRLIENNRWPDAAEILLLPCLNPKGFTQNRRENEIGIDLNRDYRCSRSAESAAHIVWLERQQEFNFYLCLHEDWEAEGFYLYEQNPDARPPLADKIIEAVRPVCPIDMSSCIEGRPAQGGIIRPQILPHERPDWPEAFYLISHKSRQGCTLEAPSDFPLTIRVDALVAAVGSILA